MRSSGWVVAAALCVASESRAELTRNIELTVFDPTPTTIGKAIQVQTADVGQSGDLVLSSWMSYAHTPLVLDDVQEDRSVVRHRTMLALGGAYAFGDKFEAGARVPFYMQSGDAVTSPTSEPPASGTVLGDLTLHGRARLWNNEAWTIGVGLTLKLPTGSDGEFVGTDLPSGRALYLMTWTPSPRTTVIVNAGAVVRKRVQFRNVLQGSGATWGAGLSQRIAEKLFLDAEAFGDVIPAGRFNEMAEETLQTTIEGLVGLRMQATPQVSIGFAAGRGLTAGIGSPAIRGVLMFSYTPSGRALPVFRKPPVIVPIDPTKHDTDFDKLVDADDKCPDQREDKDGFEDDDGCPDLDNDRDGVPDEKDKCPAQVEDRDKFEDGDGCPDDDNDKDGVADKADKCPNEPEKINGIEDNDGCPDKGESLVISTPDRLELLESVAFTGNGVAKTSADVLGQLATTLRARGDIIRLRVGVHVQPTNKADKDQALSDKRAAAVRDWLVKAGIDNERIDAKGFGGSKPLVSPSQKGAAGINDRVELIILERR